MLYMESIGQRLKAKRKDAGLTQAELGAAAGVSKQAISAIESGATQSPEAKTVEPIARRLGVSTRWLLTGRAGVEGEPESSRVAEDAPPYSLEPSQPGRPDLATLARAMRLLSFVSQIQGVRFDFSDRNADVLLMAYDLVSLKPSDFDLEDASMRMSEWLRARGQDGTVDGRTAVGAGRKAVGTD